MPETEVLTLWIAVLGVALGASSLTWQILSYLLSAGRIKVSSQKMVMVESATGTQLPVMQVTVRNVGRMPVSVTGWAFLEPGDMGHTVINPTQEYGPPLPHTLDPGHSESWRMGRDRLVEELSKTYSGTIRLTPTAWLGTGKSKEGRRIPLDLGD